MTTIPSNRQARRQGGEQPKKSNPWLWALPLFGAAIVAIIVLALTRTGGTPTGPKGVGDPVPADVLQAITQLPQSALDAVDATTALPPAAVSPIDKTPDKPVFLYVGAEFCPYCAAQRWPMIIALSRFGTFSGLKLSASSSTDAFPNTPTFTFRGSTYTSQYLELQAVETRGRVAANGSYTPLDPPNDNQQALVNKFDAAPYTSNPGAIPFVLVGESYLWVGSSLQPQLLQGLTWQNVSGGLSTPTSDASKAILANADMIIASICRVDGGQPGDVCTAPAVQAATQRLPPLKTS